MEDKEPLVSICCITYNHEDFIRDAIEGFLMQKTSFPIEIIIHDDASTDNTANIIEEYANKYPDLFVTILQSENQWSKGEGSIYARFVFPEARGKYIALCEGDDYWTDPLKLQKQVKFMEENEDCSMCVHAAKKVTVKGREVGEIRPYNKSKYSMPEDIILTSGNFFATNSYLIRKSLFEEKTPEFILISPVGDYALNLLSISKGKIYFMDNFMSNYRVDVPGSYLNKIKQVSDTVMAEKVGQRIKMLHSFNKYSNFKFNELVLKRIESLEFRKNRLDRDLKKVI